MTDSFAPHIILITEACGGGVMRHIIDLYKGLVQRNVSVTLILSPTRLEEMYRSELDTINPDDIVYIPMKRSVHWTDAKALIQLRRVVGNIPGKIILHAHSTKAALLGTCLRDLVHATVVTPHAFRGLDSELGWPARMVIETAERMYSRSYGRVIAEVQEEVEYAANLGVRPEALRLIPNGITVDKDSFPTIFARRSKLSITPTIGFVGRLTPQKRPLLYVQTLHEVVQAGVDANGIVLGSGPLKGEMVDLAKALGIYERIDWRGEVPAASVYAKMDVMLHTSGYEALPYSLIEACAALLPIVATINSGSQLILGSELPENLVGPIPEALAVKVVSILNNGEYRQSQMNALKTIALRYSNSAMIDAIVDTYSSIAQ